MRRVTARLAAVGAALAGLVVIAPPAQADVWHDRDPVDRDLYAGDIERVRVHHAERNVFVKVDFHDEMYDFVSVWLDTRPGREGPEYGALLDRSTGSFDQWLARARGFRFGRYVRCRAMTSSYERGHDTVRMTIPRRCLRHDGSAPRRLRAAVISEGEGRDTDWAPGRRQFGRWIPAD